MSNRMKKWWLAAILIVGLAPVTFADRDHRRDHGCDPHTRQPCQVPEGGSNFVYLLGAGMTCLGAMFLKSRSAKSA
jgi:hypothetical protein